MRFLRSLVLLAASLVFVAQAQQLDRIVAIVDDSVVTQTQLEQRIDQIRQRFADDPSQLPAAAVLREQVLDRLIVEEIQLQMARRGGVQVPDDQIDMAFAELAAANGMNPREFLDQLSAMGQTSVTQVITNIRDELVLQQLQQSQVSRRIQITQAEVDNFLESAEGRMWTAPELNLQHIFLPLPGNASPNQVAQAEDILQDIYSQLEQGTDFESLAVQYSASPTALEGGTLGWRRAIEFAPELGSVLDATPVGEVSDPVRAAAGIHIFKVNAQRDSTQSGMVQQTKTRHILVRPNEIRSGQQAEELIQLIHQRLLEGESFEELARTFSDDVSNALQGGDLGWVLPGVMVPEFEAAMEATATGDISQPVQTQFGWHVLEVQDRRDVDMSNEILRNQASNMIANQRFEEELDLWLREIRSEAFVQILD